jgi:hypothetical protein
MRTILKTTDLVLLSYASHLLAEAGIEHEIFDSNISATEGCIGVFPSRLIIIDDNDFPRARLALAELAEHLYEEKQE